MKYICCWCGAEKDNQWGMCGTCFRFPVTKSYLTHEDIMKTKNMRFHLRHTGSRHFRLRPRHVNLNKAWGGDSNHWGHNFEWGRLVLCVRRPSSHARGFFDLEFGRNILRAARRG